MGVNDVGGMSLHSMSILVPDFYVVCLCNSFFMSRYSETFINFTVNFQINDARILPIIIPTSEQLKRFKNLFNKALEFRRLHSEHNGEIMNELNLFVNELYSI